MNTVIQKDVSISAVPPQPASMEAGAVGNPVVVPMQSSVLVAAAKGLSDAPPARSKAYEAPDDPLFPKALLPDAALLPEPRPSSQRTTESQGVTEPRHGGCARVVSYLLPDRRNAKASSSVSVSTGTDFNPYVESWSQNSR